MIRIATERAERRQGFFAGSSYKLAGCVGLALLSSSILFAQTAEDSKAEIAPAPTSPDVQVQPAPTSVPVGQAAAPNTMPVAPKQPAVTSKLFSISNPQQPPVPAGSDGLQLNFTDTDIAIVVSAVLGDGLGLPYVIDPQVKGTLTLQAARPLSSQETLIALETALRTQGAALVDVNGVMNVVPVKDAPKRMTALRVPNQGEPGFGIYVVPLQYVSAADMEKLLQPFAPEGGIIRVDSSRNLLLLAGTSQEISTLMGVINTFDVDWLAGMSMMIYTIQQVDAKTLASELGEVFSDSKSPIAGVVRIVPLTRLNALLVITPQEKYLSEVEEWIKRLDVSTTTPGRRIYVYDVQNGKADELSKSLSSILSLSSSSSVTTSSTTSSSSQPTATLGATASQPASRQATPTSNQGSSDTDVGALKVVPNSENNSLLIMASPTEYGVIEAALKRLDVVPLQILIEASIAEITLTDDLKFGLQWSYDSKNGPIVFSSSSSGAISQQYPGLSFLYTGRTNIQAVLNSLETLTNVHVLSSPKLLVLNNREAHLQIGDEVPIATQSAISTSTSAAPIVNSVQLMDTGVILTVTPRANSSGRIFLEVNQEVSNVVPTTTSGIDSPTIQQRKVSSTISVDSGDTIALGGLIKETVNKTRTGVPIVSRIPLIGALFGSTGNTKTRTEMIILLTPRIIRSSDEASRTTEELKKEFGDLKKMIPRLKTMSNATAVPNQKAANDGRAAQ